MALHLLCKDPESPNNGSPTLYYDDESRNYLLQGWRVADSATRLSDLVIPEHETIVEFPSRLLRLFPAAGGTPQD
ncbi:MULTISPECIES: hypothetical protein [unclassified Streptomyces]|uniref:hypothetical protein n=1 Tax=unclassified Streptomyces TaxID=2593676 RepID=UPI00081E2518|nr:hypothetical protein [Streptomyces sp. ScaeMP-e83]MYR97969.1 hypothetical protein [Streptomyces sp. SID4937]SCE32356.1 hypothetical protein GA0115243_110645 [Streptomyces sp. ScaeMP-e83]